MVDDFNIIKVYTYMHEKIYLLSIRRFFIVFLNDIPFKTFLLKMKKTKTKNNKFGLNYHTHTVQPLVLRILRRSF